MSDGEIEVRTGLQVKDERDKKIRNLNREDAFNNYNNNNGLNYLALIDPEKVLEAEKERFDLALKTIKWFQQVKTTLLGENDYQNIGGKKFVKKSGVKKLQNAFNISTEIIDINERVINWGSSYSVGGIQTNPDGKELVITVRVRASRKAMIRNPNTGQTIEIILGSTENTASCSNMELATKKKQSYSYHNVMATATTRALNRAVLDILSGDVSAEEMLPPEEMGDVELTSDKKG